MIANSIDLEHDHGKIIEVGLATINLKTRKILNKYSMPVIQEEISQEVSELTGWTVAKLKKQGSDLEEVRRRLFDLYACRNRLLILDCADELTLFPSEWGFSLDRINVSTVFKIKSGLWKNLSLTDMMAERCLKFEGTLHRAVDDAFNIGRLFLELI